MGYKIYKPAYIELRTGLGRSTVVYFVRYEAKAWKETLEGALEVAVSMARATYGNPDPTVRIENGARGSLTAVELYHQDFHPIRLPNGYTPGLSPAIIIKNDRMKDTIERTFSFTNPLVANGRR